METWTRTEIQEIAEVFLGKTPAKTAYRSEGTHKVIKFRDLKDGYVHFETSKDGFVDSDDTTKGYRELHVGDVLITSAAHSGENIGKKCALLTSIPDKFERTIFTGELLNIRTPDPTLARWVFYYFRSADGFKELQNAVSGVHLTSGRAKLMEVPLAPLNEQKRIVEKLEKLLGKMEAAQERLDKIPAILKRFRQSVLAAACSGKLTVDWRTQNDCDSPSLLTVKMALLDLASNGRERSGIEKAFEYAMSVSEPLEIPETWASSTIGTIGLVSNGSTPSRKVDDYWSGDIPWVSSGEVRNNLIADTRERITNAGFKNSSTRILPRGTVLLAMIGEGKTRGQTAILQIEATINQNVASIVPAFDFVYPQYLWYSLRSQYDSNRERGSGSGPQALNCERVREIPFGLPPLEEQKEIVRRVYDLFKFADQIEERYKKARSYTGKLTQSNLAKAFRGELVPQTPTTNPPRNYSPGLVRKESRRSLSLQPPRLFV